MATHMQARRKQTDRSFLLGMSPASSRTSHYSSVVLKCAAKASSKPTVQQLPPRGGGDRRPWNTALTCDVRTKIQRNAFTYVPSDTQALDRLCL